MTSTARNAAQEVRLDTHVIVWLYTGESQRLSKTAVELIEERSVVVSPMVQMELSYLHEIDRLRVGGADIVADLGRRIGLALSLVPLAAAVDAAASLSWTRDPFDRLIAGDALASGSQLLTMDAQLLEHVSLAIW